MNYKYKDFKGASKVVMDYNNKSIIGKLLINIKMPIKYIQFKKVLKRTDIVKGDDKIG